MSLRWGISWIVGLLLGVCGASGNETDPSEADYRFHPDVQRLVQTRYFGMGGFGLPLPREPGKGQDVLEGAALLRRFLLREDGIRFLFPVFEHGTVEAKCYALIGFHKLAPDYFEKCARRLEPWSQQEVRVAAGCVIGERTLGDLIMEIRRGTFDVWVRPR